MSLTYSITGFLIVLGLAGKHVMASDVAIVQGSVLATFYVFSGDARHLILAGNMRAQNVIFFRLICFLPLAFLSYFMSVHVGQVNAVIACGLILRRSAEWLAEPHVTEIEHQNNKWSGWYLQPLIFLAFISQVVFTQELWFIWFWAVSPIMFSLKFMINAESKNAFNISWENIASTAIIGLTGYIQRLLIVSFVGKEFSGMLFPGFAIGSFVGTMAANVAGPTLVNKGLFNSKYLTGSLILLFFIGLLMYVTSETVLYQTMGLSIIGGAAMIAAQQSRLILLKENHTLELDLLFQLVLVFSVPALYYLIGNQGLMWFYLLGSLIAWLFYNGNIVSKKINKKWQLRFAFLVTLGLVVPIFFQLSGIIYNNELIAVVDSDRGFQQVPLPISLLFCYLGVFLFSAGYSRTKPAILTISAMFLLLITSTIIVNQGAEKLILLMQYILPTVALLLGIALVGFDRKYIAKVFLLFLIIFVPAQLLMTWIQGRLSLTHYMYVFSVYAHYQYVPLVIAGLYAWTLVELRHSHAMWLHLLAPWMGMYVAAGNSTIALFGLVVFTSIYALCALIRKKRRSDMLIPLFIITTIASYFYINTHLAYEIDQKLNERWECKSGELKDGLNGACLPGLYEDKFFDQSGNFIYFHQKSHIDKRSQLPANVMERKEIASFYMEDIAKHPLTLLYGHSSPPPRNVVLSVHNYYLDLIYNFGLLACLPLLALVLYTTRAVYKQKNDDSALIWLLAIVMYFIIVDNLFKTTLRQPYSGIITFFLWGALLGVLNFRTREVNASRVKSFS